MAWFLLIFLQRKNKKNNNPILQAEIRKVPVGKIESKRLSKKTSDQKLKARTGRHVVKERLVRSLQKLISNSRKKDFF
jgi:hypothetical protein